MRFVLLISTLLFSQLLMAATSLQLQSPGKRLHAILSVKNGGLSYKLKLGSVELIENSHLGMRLTDFTLGTGVQALTLKRRYRIADSFETRLNAAYAKVSGIAYQIEVREPAMVYTIEFRLYDEGCAFRYVLPVTDSIRVREEYTGFTLPATSGVWFFERNSKWKLQSYAGLWMKTSVEKLQTVSSQGPVQGKPIVVELPSGGYMVIAEAALYNYSGMRLKAAGRSLQVNFTEEQEGFTVKGPLVTPWRVIMYAPDLNKLVNNHLPEHLNPAEDQKLFSDKSYIQPGKSVWSWITRGENYMQPAEEKKMIDAASSLQMEYSLLDEGWETTWPHKWQQLKELCAYAASKHVKLWVWKHSKELRDSLHRERFLDSVAIAGAAGVKTDFMNGESKDLIDFDEAFLRAAARHRLMVNFHGCQSPSGESRTYPNEMTREGIRGMELNIMNEPIPAWHNAALPFTRFLCGHGDYTPGFFSNRGNTTLTHQLALLYLFNSPFQCLAENPVSLLNEPVYAPILKLLRSLPVTWDETIVLPGSSIGTVAAFARRKGNDWYVAAINGADTAVSIRLLPSFLKTGFHYTAYVIEDDMHNTAFAVKDITIQPSREQLFTIPPTGGLVIAVKRK